MITDLGSPGDSGLDAIILTSRLDDKPKEDIDHIHNPNRSIQVQSIPQHELPIAQGLNLERLD